MNVMAMCATKDKGPAMDIQEHALYNIKKESYIIQKSQNVWIPNKLKQIQEPEK